MAPKGWLDVHTHFYTWSSEPERQIAIQGMRDACFMVADSWSWSVDDSLAYQDQAGVQMQLLSYLPQTIEKLRAANDFAADVVKRHPSRFGMLCALPTDDPKACLAEIERGRSELDADGFAVSAVYKDVMLSSPALDPVWSRLNALSEGAVVFSHPNAYAPPKDGRPTPLIEVAFETARVIVDLLYRRTFTKYPNVKFVFSHCGGVLPMLAGRLELLGGESWVPNPEKLTSKDIKEELSRIWVDCAATAETGLQPAIKMVGSAQVVYGADCGVPCSRSETMERNRKSVKKVLEELGLEEDLVGRNGWNLFPRAAARAKKNEVNGIDAH
ncbi:C6 transcription factor [Teratosphaeria destructans]|uniref:6-methylsalicylate decarboxylase n=1 Tax=Teratosphaeria destructans TaxID=418781 RepID=A0A9W7W452_9PEZI|nr:C6 transcription factor [Teratosphaeria destructans]